MDHSINKIDSKRLKGIAIIMMVSMHILKLKWIHNPELIIDIKILDIYLSTFLSEILHASTAIFAFITGYVWGKGYFKKNKGKDKILSLYISFWIVTLLVNFTFIELDSVINNHNLLILTSSELLKNLLALSSDISKFSWYISFFAVAVLTYPVINKIILRNNKNVYIKVLNILFIFLLLRIFNQLYFSNDFFNKDILSFISHYALTMPCLLIGSVVAQNGIYDRWNNIIKKSIYVNFLILVVIFVIKGSLYCLNIKADLEMFWVIFEIFAINNILKILVAHYKTLDKVLLELGEYSLYIWLIHSIFLLDIMQRIYLFRFPIIIVVTVLIVSYIISIFVKYIDLQIKKFVNHVGGI